MADSSFDIVSKVDRQEVDNALNQAAKELSQRFDFKNTSTTIEWKGELAVEITSSHRGARRRRARRVQGQAREAPALAQGARGRRPALLGQGVQDLVTFKAGINQEQAKKLGKLIRDEGPKTVKAQVMGEELRVTSKSRDDLQAVQSLVRDADLDFAVQFVNYR